MQHTLEFPHSRHAETRMRQRGIKQSSTDLFLSRADKYRDVGHGCSVWFWSDWAAEQARIDGVPPSEIDRVRDLSAILAEDGTVVTYQNRETNHAKYQIGNARLTCRQRAIRKQGRNNWGTSH